MFPLSDDNPTQRFPILTVLLIAVNTLVFLFEISLEGGRAASLVGSLGVVPARLTHAPDGRAALSLITSQFLHGSWLHLGGNMLFLWIFGNNIEDHLGRLLFLPFYLAAGLAAGLTQVMIYPHSNVPTIGASGAIAGVLGAYFVLYPRARIRTLIILVFFIRIVSLPAALWLGIWFVIQVVFGLAGLATGGESGGTAWFAHLGGFLFGFLAIHLTGPLKRREAPVMGFDGRGWLGS